MLLAVLLVNVAFMYGCAPKIYEYDSLKLPELEKKTFGKHKSYPVIKLYCGRFASRIAKFGSVDYTIDDILDHTDNTSYISVSPEDNSVCWVVDTGAFDEYKFFAYDEPDRLGWEDFFKYALDPQLAFADFEEPIEVYNVWCLEDVDWHEYQYIYYSTSEGSYVLFNEPIYSGGNLCYVPTLYSWDDMYPIILARFQVDRNRMG